MNTYGYIFRLTSFGESHGLGVGGSSMGVPLVWNSIGTSYSWELNRRRPGQSRVTTSRDEPDQVEFLSGLFGREVYRCAHRLSGEEP